MSLLDDFRIDCADFNEIMTEERVVPGGVGPIAKTVVIFRDEREQILAREFDVGFDESARDEP